MLSNLVLPILPPPLKFSSSEKLAQPVIDFGSDSLQQSSPLFGTKKGHHPVNLILATMTITMLSLSGLYTGVSAIFGDDPKDKIEAAIKKCTYNGTFNGEKLINCDCLEKELGVKKVEK